MKIEKDVPIPARRKLNGLVELLRQMKIGDSVFVKTDDSATMRNTARYALGKGATTTRAEGKGYRVWRIK
jgi:TusA-related sulfurtransferase